MIFNVLLFMIACIYWFYTGHDIPAYFGFLLLLSLVNDKLYFATLILCAMTITAVIYYFWIDFFAYKPDDDIFQHGTGIIYMLVVFIKAKRVFDNDEFLLD